MGHIFAQVWVQVSLENGVVIMVTKFSRSWPHVDWCNFCIHLRSLIARHL
jgi:hypothetical protein